jgi:predicted short-subunit dehydrogenase-like oxidoreductase (DUF2520 family)
MIFRIVILGAGRLARHLALTLIKSDCVITAVWNRSPESGIALAKQVHSPFISDISNIPTNADLYLCAVSDSAIAGVAAQIPLHNRLIVHTSGSVSMNVLQPTSDEIGVFYPLQTFSCESEIDFSTVPICIEASSEKSMEILRNIGQSLSNTVIPVNSDDRRILHLGAVMVSNFTNFLYTLADDLIQRNHLPPGILNPLILQTAKNAILGDPRRFQTGPAVRNDTEVIRNHLKMLAQDPEIREIYQLITEKIMKYHAEYGKL